MNQYRQPPLISVKTAKQKKRKEKQKKYVELRWTQRQPKIYNTISHKKHLFPVNNCRRFRFDVIAQSTIGRPIFASFFSFFFLSFRTERGEPQTHSHKFLKYIIILMEDEMEDETANK